MSSCENRISYYKLVLDFYDKEQLNKEDEKFHLLIEEAIKFDSVISEALFNTNQFQFQLDEFVKNTKIGLRNSSSYKENLNSKLLHIILLASKIEDKKESFNTSFVNFLGRYLFNKFDLLVKEKQKELAKKNNVTIFSA